MSEFEKGVVLPVCRPSIASFLHHANSLCIVETLPRARHYLVNYFLQLYVGAGHEGNIDFYSCDGMYPRYPFIHRGWLPTLTLKAMSNSLADLACGMLDSGCYLDALLDEYYLSAHWAYRRQHYLHQNLIYGYSREQGKFLAMGFDRVGRYEKFTISFDEFAEGIAGDAGLSVVGRTELVEYNNSEPFSPLLITTYLRDFLDSRNSFKSFRPPSGIFGLATYDKAIDDLETGMRMGAAIDIRPWSVFHEHKEKLLALHDYLVEEKKLVLPEQAREDLAALRDDFLWLRNHLMESAVERKQVNIPVLKRNLAEIKGMEAEAISSLIAAVESAGSGGQA